MSTTPYAIGMDVGGTNVKVVAADRDGRVLARGEQATGDGEGASWRIVARDLYRSVQHGLGEPAWVGVAGPGIADTGGRSIWWMIGRMDSTMGFEWREWLGRDRPVPVWNDAQAALLGETWCGAARGATNAVLLTLGTGVGGAILCDGRLLRGHLGRAGHLGHMSLDPDGPADITNTPGAIEYQIGNYSLAERSGGRYTDTRELVAAHVAGDADASRIWLTSVKALAAHVAGVINAVDPEVVIIGGGVVRAGEALFAPLRRHLDEFEWRPHGRQVRLAAAALGADAGALGAAYGAIRQTEEHA
jgi:glucokinase